MKLSDIKGERTLDVIADLIDPIANIAEDKDAALLFKKQKAPKGMSPEAFLIRRLKIAVPKLLKAHKKDVISILSTIEGTSPQSYESTLNLAKLTNDYISLLTDEAFMSLFSSAQDGETPSGSARVSTEAPKA